MEVVMVAIVVIVCALLIVRSVGQTVSNVKYDIETSPKNPAGEFSPKYLRYENYNDAVLVKRDPYIRKILSVEAQRNVNLSYTPDKVVYTSATVGRVTTGGIDTIKGGYTVHSGSKTGNYYLWHGFARMSMNRWEGDMVFRIVLSQSDYEKAKKDSVLQKYISTRNKGGKSEYYLNVGYTSKTDCEYILSWMCMSN